MSRAEDDEIAAQMAAAASATQAQRIAGRDTRIAALLRRIDAQTKLPYRLAADLRELRAELEADIAKGGRTG